MIPKVIHYCWFGGNEKPELVKKCIESWKKFCPDWEIIEWNESNYDVRSLFFACEAYEAGKWAFVSDVARLDIINSHGGIYLDTDVELLGSLDEWLKYDAVFCFETERYINTGMGFAAVKSHRAIKSMLDRYSNLHFIENGKMKLIPCPASNTEGLCSYSKDFKQNGSMQLINGMKILSINEYASIAKHHYAGTWVTGKAQNMRVYKDTKWKRFIRKPKHFEFIDKHFGKCVVDFYTFLVYDLTENGVLYFLKRKISKIRKK